MWGWIVSRHDEALLRIYLSAMPLGKYHTKDSHPYDLYRDGKHVAHIDSADSGRAQEGLVAALVHLLNTREQREIPR